MMMMGRQLSFELNVEGIVLTRADVPMDAFNQRAAAVTSNSLACSSVAAR